jgi:predicted SAM-dependent methyltransferase
VYQLTAMTAVQTRNQELRFASAAAHEPRRVLNAGSGLKSIERLGAVFDRSEWDEIRIDLDPGVAPDVVGSMTDMRAHFDARTFDAIWSSHSLEHLHSHEIPVALAEFRRILKADGFALITCPDLETVMTLFLNHGPDHVIYQSPAGPITPLDMMFGHARSIAAGHVHMAHNSGLTAARLTNLLRQAGFADAIVKRQEFDLWAVGLMPQTNRNAILRKMADAGLDLSDTARNV